MPSESQSIQSKDHSPVTITRASIGDADKVAVLFDLYRQFYDQDSDVELAKDYILNHLSSGTSVIFLAWVDDHAVAFTQIYASFCSVDARPICILYDLFVSKEARQLGVGKALMNKARVHAIETGASRIDLETDTENLTAQRLYESLGYERDNVFFKYSLEF